MRAAILLLAALIFLFFHGNGRVNIFTTAERGGESWCKE